MHLFERRPALWVTLGVISPLVVAAIVLFRRDWVPVLDMVMTEFRVKDVGGRDTPLVGLPGRIGNFPDQGSHPGPWSFYLVAPFYRLAGSIPWGMQLASVLINSVCAAAIVWLGHRRYGARGAVVFGAVVAVTVRGYGLNVLTHPWNPYFGVMLWLLALIAAWFVLAGDQWMAVIVVVTTNLVAQTHVPYLPSAIALNALVLGWLGWQIVAARRGQSSGPVRPILTMLAVGGLFWLPPLAQQLRDDPGNIVRLIRHFATEQPEQSIGLWSALKLVSQHFDLLALFREFVMEDQAFVQRASQAGSFSLIGLLTLVGWVSAALWAIRRRHRDLLALHAVIAVALLAGWVSISRIFGRVWFYLTLWMSAAVMLAVLAMVWTAWILVLEHRAARAAHEPDRRPIIVSAVCAAVLATALSLVAALDLQEPDHVTADAVRSIVPDVDVALTAGVGTTTGQQGEYMVFWQESVFPGAHGFGLLGELERLGYQVGVDNTWRVPATPQRVLDPGSVDGEIHLVTGSYIDEWRARTGQGYIEVAEHDGRSDAERQRFEELASRVDDRLLEIGRPDLIPIVDLNILGVSLEPGLPSDIVDDLGEMLDLGEPVAVFIAPPGAFLRGIAGRNASAAAGS